MRPGLVDRDCAECLDCLLDSPLGEVLEFPHGNSVVLVDGRLAGNRAQVDRLAYIVEVL